MVDMVEMVDKMREMVNDKMREMVDDID